VDDDGEDDSSNAKFRALLGFIDNYLHGDGRWVASRTTHGDASVDGSINFSKQTYSLSFFVARCTPARTWFAPRPEVTSYPVRHVTTSFGRTCTTTSGACWWPSLCTIAALRAPSGGQCSHSAGISPPRARLELLCGPEKKRNFVLLL